LKIEKIPVVLKLLLPLVTGILVGYFSDFQVSFSLLLCLSGLTIILCLPLLSRIYSLRNSIGIIVIPLFFTLGVFIEELNDTRTTENYFVKKSIEDSLNYYHLKITEPPVKKADWIKCDVEVIGTNNNASTGKAQLYIERNDTSENLKYGDLLYAQVNFFEVNEPANPNEFNYKEYLRINDIHQQAFIHQSQWIKAGNDANSFFDFIFGVRDRCNSILETSGMSTENIAVAKALIIGDKELIDDELMLSYAASGALHVLAVSGLHVGIIMLILTFVFSPVKRIKNGKVLFIIIAISGIWFYSIITGLSPSVLRAAVMFSFVILGNELQRETSIYQSLLVSAMLLIIIDPHIIFKLGFLLSYLAVFGIVFFHPKIFAMLHFKNFILHKTWQITSISIAAQIATFPIGIYCFQQFPNFFLLANLIVIPLSFIILIVGIAYMVFVSVPFVNDLLLFILDWFIWGLNVSVRWVEQLPYSVFWGISIQWYDVLLLYGFIFTLTFSLRYRAKKLLILSLVFLTCSVGMNAFEKNNFHHQNQLVFYSIKNEVAVDIFYGQKNYFLASESLMTNENKLRYHIYPNRYLHAGSSQPDQSVSLCDTTNILEINHKKILILNQLIAEEKFSEKFPLSDVVYLHDINFLQSETIDHLTISDTKIIYGYGVSNSLKSYLNKKIDKNLIYDLKKTGALQVNF